MSVRVTPGCTLSRFPSRPSMRLIEEVLRRAPPSGTAPPTTPVVAPETVSRTPLFPQSESSEATSPADSGQATVSHHPRARFDSSSRRSAASSSTVLRPSSLLRLGSSSVEDESIRSDTSPR